MLVVGDDDVANAHGRGEPPGERRPRARRVDRRARRRARRPGRIARLARARRRPDAARPARTRAGAGATSSWRAPGADDADGDACIFCALADGADRRGHRGRRPRPSTTFVVLNAFPYGSGHVLVLPRRHVARIDELDRRRVRGPVAVGDAGRSGPSRSAYRPDGANLGANLGRAGGAGIPGHLHLHVLPRWGGDTNFMTAIAETRVLPESLDGHLRQAARRLRPLAPMTTRCARHLLAGTWTRSGTMGQPHAAVRPRRLGPRAGRIRCLTDGSERPSTRSTEPIGRALQRAGVSADMLTATGLLSATGAARRDRRGAVPPRHRPPHPDGRPRPLRRGGRQGVGHRVGPRRLLRLGHRPRRRRPAPRRRGVVPGRRTAAGTSSLLPLAILAGRLPRLVPARQGRVARHRGEGRAHGARRADDPARRRACSRPRSSSRSCGCCSASRPSPPSGGSSASGSPPAGPTRRGRRGAARSCAGPPAPARGSRTAPSPPSRGGAPSASRRRPRARGRREAREHRRANRTHRTGA